MTMSGDSDVSPPHDEAVQNRKKIKAQRNLIMLCLFISEGGFL